jgi:hypothetical protein
MIGFFAGEIVLEPFSRLFNVTISDLIPGKVLHLLVSRAIPLIAQAIESIFGIELVKLYFLTGFGVGCKVEAHCRYSSDVATKLNEYAGRKHFIDLAHDLMDKDSLL